MNKIFTLTIATLMMLALQATAQETPKNCKQILGLNPSATSGVYTIDPDGDGPQPEMQCQCDMTTDGGGWTLVLNYNHLDGTNPDLTLLTTTLPIVGSTALGTDESATPFWGHADTALLNAIAFDEVHFYGITTEHSRVIDFKTSHPGTVSYFRTGLGSTAGISSDFTPLAQHTAFLPASINASNPNAGNFAMTEYPLWTASAYHWFLSPSTGRWEADGYTYTLPSTLHQLWVRGCVSYSSVEIRTCESYTSPSGDYTWTENGIYMDTIPNNGGCDSIITIDLTIDELAEITVTENGNSLVADQLLDTYQWVDCDNGNAEITDATEQTFTAAISGNYAVVVTSGVCELTSECYQVITVGLNDTPKVTELAIYPNPSNANITLTSATAFSNASITLTDLQGRTVMDISNVSGSTAVVDISNLPSSIYTVQILDKGAVSRLKLIRE